MSTATRDGAIAIVRASSVTNAPTSGYKYPVNLSPADIKGKARFIKRNPGIVPDTDQMIGAGFDYDWTIPDISPECNMFGYLTALAFGTHSYGAGVITITPSDVLQWLNVLKDDGLDKGTSTPTERLIGGKVNEWSFECMEGELAKMSLGGVGCDMGALAAALTPSIPSGADNAPISWESFKGTGYIQMAYNAGVLADEDDVQGFRFRLSRPAKTSGRTAGSTQPGEIHHGTRVLTAEIFKEFSGANALAQYNAWKNQHLFALQVKAVVGTYYVIVGPVYGKVIDSIPGPVGGDSEDPIKGGITIECYKYGSNLIAAEIEDGSVAAYW